MNNKNLLFIFLALLGVYLGYQFFSGNQERSFRSDVVAVNIDEVDKIILMPKVENHAAITLTKTSQTWEISKADFNTSATTNAVNNLLQIVKKIKAKRVATKNTGKWALYEVDEKNGSQVQIFSGNKMLADFVVGKFNMDQQARTFTSYVRLSDENEVYEVDGFLSASFNQKMDSFRDKKMIQFNTPDITEFSIQSENRIQNISKLMGNWSTSSGVALDSTVVVNYLNGIKNLSGGEFINDFQPITPPNKTITIKGNNMAEPIIVNCYLNKGEKPFVLHSNLNKEANFLSDSSGIYKKLFEFKF